MLWCIMVDRYWLIRSVIIWNMQQEVRDINNFYSQFSITKIDSETQIVRSASHSYLVKLIRLEQDNANLDNVVETL